VRYEEGQPPHRSGNVERALKHLTIAASAGGGGVMPCMPCSLHLIKVW